MASELFLIVIVLIALFVLWSMIIIRIKQSSILEVIYKEPLFILFSVIGTVLILGLVVEPLIMVVLGE